MTYVIDIDLQECIPSRFMKQEVGKIILFDIIQRLIEHEVAIIEYRNSKGM